MANPLTGDKTMLAGTDDSTPGQVYVYVGTKTNTGNAVEKAGLANGILYGVKVIDGGSNYANGAVPREFNGAISGSFILERTGFTPGISGGTLQANSVTKGITEFARPEDAAWLSKDTLVFATTGAGVTAVGGTTAVTQTSKLYKLTFSDLNDPAKGGSISVIVDSDSLIGKDGQKARTFDNLTIGGDGLIYVQEDPGNNAYVAKHWVIDPNAADPSKTALQILESDRTRFVTGGSDFRTVDEEHSGIIDITSVVNDGTTNRYFLVATQNHAAAATPDTYGLVEGGQFVLLSTTAAGNPLEVSGTLKLEGARMDLTNGLLENRNIALSSTGGVVNVSSGSATLTGNLSGTGQLWKTGAGELTLSGAGAYGDTNVSEGTLALTGSVTTNVRNLAGGTLKIGGNVTGSVNNWGTISGAGKVTGDVSNWGRFAPGNSPGITTIVGNYTEAGLLDIEIGGTVAGANPNGYDQLKVSGAFTTSSAGTLKVTKFNGFEPERGQTFRVVEAGSYSGTFGRVDRSSLNTQALFDAATGTIYGTGLAETESFADLAGANSNRRQVAAALYADGVRTGSVVKNGATVASTAKVFMASGALGAAAKAFLTDANPGDVLDALSPEAYVGVNEYMTRSAFALAGALRSAPLGAVGLNANAGFLWNQLQSRGSTTTISADSQGNASFLSIGYGLSDAAVLSVIGSIEEGRINASNFSGKSEGNSIGIGWASELGGGRLDIGLTHGIHDVSATRSAQTARVNDAVGTVLAGRYTLPPFSGFTPFMGMSVSSSRIEAFSESGSEAALKVGKISQKRSVAEVGLGYARPLSESVSLNLNTSYEHNFRRDKNRVDAGFAGGSGTFAVERSQIGNDAVRAGGGVSLSFGKAGTVNTGYEFSAGSQIKSAHALKAVYSISF